MNLFYTPTLSELDILVEQTRLKNINYNILVDNDGEVIIDNKTEVSPKQLSRYKFYFKDIKYNHDIWKHRENKLNTLNQLFKNLVFCWENGVTGHVDFNRISRIQNQVFHHESRQIRKKSYPLNLNVMI